MVRAGPFPKGYLAQFRPQMGLVILYSVVYGNNFNPGWRVQIQHRLYKGGRVPQSQAKVEDLGPSRIRPQSGGLADRTQMSCPLVPGAGPRPRVQVRQPQSRQLWWAM